MSSKSEGSSWNRAYLSAILKAIVIFSSPFLIYLHLLFEDELQTFSFLGISIFHGYFGNHVFVWYVLSSFIPVLLLGIWYISSPHKWKYFILLPTSIGIWGLSSVLIENYIVIIGLIILGIICIISIRTFIFNRNAKTINVYNGFKYYLNTGGKSFFYSLKIRKKVLFADKAATDSSAYFSKIYHLKTVLNDRLSRYGFSIFNDVKIENKNIDMYVSITLIVVFLFSFVYLLIPEEIMELNLGIFTIGNFGFLSFDSFLWYFSSKIAILIPLCVWYSISNDWWKYSILSPIFLYTYQLWEIFQGVDYLEEVSNFRIIPLILVVLFVLAIMSKTMQYEFKIMDVYEDVVKEIDRLIVARSNQKVLKEDGLTLEHLKKKANSNKEKEQQLEELLLLKKTLEQRLTEDSD